MVVEKPARESCANKPEPLKLVLPDGTPKDIINFDSNRFAENNLPSVFNRNEILLQSNISAKNPGLIRNMFINKYIKTQGNYVFLENNPVIEIKI
jgi:hypothetical protein